MNNGSRCTQKQLHRKGPLHKSQFAKETCTVFQLCWHLLLHVTFSRNLAYPALGNGGALFFGRDESLPEPDQSGKNQLQILLANEAAQPKIIANNVSFFNNNVSVLRVISLIWYINIYYLLGNWKWRSCCSPRWEFSETSANLTCKESTELSWHRQSLEMP